MAWSVENVDASSQALPQWNGFGRLMETMPWWGLGEAWSVKDIRHNPKRYTTDQSIEFMSPSIGYDW